MHNSSLSEASLIMFSNVTAYLIINLVICSISDSLSLNCIHGSIWKKSCSTCYCILGQVLCIAQVCSRAGTTEIRKAQEIAHIQDYNTLIASPVGGSATTDEVCTEGHVWINDCNTCFCANGTSFCTEKQCIDPSESGLKIEADSLRSLAKEVTNAIVLELNSLDCKEGSRWRRGCNWCSCVNGFHNCTNRQCEKEDIFDKQGPFCEDGSQWTDHCSVCKCIGGLPMCAETQCSATTRIRSAVLKKKIKSRVSKCKNGSTWKDGCKLCTCKEGKVSCSNDKCSGDDTKIEKAIHLLNDSDESDDGSAQEDNRSCTEGSRWRKECNRCFCEAGKQICEAKECFDGNELDGSCEENSHWKIGCNWCKCMNGRAVCTSETCSQDESTETAEPKISVCRANHSWTYDCNVCVCAEGYFVCTQRPCSDMEEIKSGHCVRQDMWKEDCRDCVCHYGQKACSKKKCLESGAQEKALSTSGRQSNTEITGDQKENCFLPIMPGTCQKTLPRYAYNSESLRCEPFVYTGCEGNKNNFLALEECLVHCEGAGQLDCPKVECPDECTPTIDSSSGCQSCNCTANNPECINPICWSSCLNPRIEFQESVGCFVCKCQCMTDDEGKPPCPQDCSVVIVYDEIIGCDLCICDPDDPANELF